MTITLFIIGLSLAGITFVIWQARGICRAERHASARAQIIRADRERAERAAQVDGLELAWNLPTYQRPDPDLDAGCDRLRDAIRVEQQKGDTA